MARRIKVSTIGAQNMTNRFEDGLEKAVEEMLSHWKDEFSNVLCDKPDLIVVPECCDRYVNYTNEQRLQYYEYRADRILSYFSETARKNSCYITYSSIWPGGDGKNRNSLIMLDRKGEIVGIYDKFHLVPYEISGINGYCGDRAVLFECDFGKVGAVICFDLNFEKIRKLYMQKKMDLMLFSSMYHGSFMQNLWAYDLRCYFVSAVANLECSVINPVGKKIAATTNYTSYLTQSINLDCEVVHLDENQCKLKAAKEKYGSKISVFDPGYLGAVLLTSETDEFTVGEIVEEFHIKRIDDYFTHCLEMEDKERAKRKILNPYARNV